MLCYLSRSLSTFLPPPPVCYFLRSFFFLSSVICYVLFSLALRFKFSTLFTSLFMLVLFFFFFFVILLTLFLLSFVVIIVGPAPLCSLQDGRRWELVDSKLSFISAHLPSFS